MFDVDDVLEEIKSDASLRIYIDFLEPRKIYTVGDTVRVTVLNVMIPIKSKRRYSMQ